MGSESTAFLQEGQVVRGIGQEYGPRLPEAQVLRSRRSQNRFVKTPLYCYFFTMEMRWSRFDDLTNQELYEILALRQAAARLGSWRLCGARLYVTLEPCVMCAGALVHARIDELVYGCDDPKAGAVRSRYQLCEDARLNHRLQVTGGVLAEACGRLLSDFFAGLRELRRSR